MKSCDIADEIVSALKEFGRGSRQGHRPSAQEDFGVYTEISVSQQGSFVADDFKSFQNFIVTSIVSDNFVYLCTAEGGS